MAKKEVVEKEEEKKIPVAEGSEEEGEQKPKKNLITNKMVIALIIIVFAGLAIFLVTKNVMKKFSSSDDANGAEVTWQRVSDSLENIVGNANVAVMYGMDTTGNNLLICIGTESFYGVKFLSEKKELQVYQGFYSAEIVGTEQMIAVARQELGLDINTGGKFSGTYKTLAKNITNYAVDNAPGDGKFTSDTVDVSFSVELSDENSHNKASYKIPEAKVIESAPVDEEAPAAE